MSKAAGSTPSSTSSQVERRRDRGVRVRPDRVGRRDRLALPVLVRVDQDAAPAGLRPLRRRELRMRPRDRARDELGEARACRRRSICGRAGRGRGSPCRPTSSGTTRGRAGRAAPSGSARPRSCSPTACRASGRDRRARSRGGRACRSREYHVFMSMQPMLTIQRSASSSFTTGRSIHCFVARLVARRDERVEGRDPVRHVGRGVLLEEDLPEGAVGIAAHREGPVLQVRDEDGSDGLVVARGGRPS